MTRTRGSRRQRGATLLLAMAAGSSLATAAVASLDVASVLTARVRAQTAADAAAHAAAVALAIDPAARERLSLDLQESPGSCTVGRSDGDPDIAVDPPASDGACASAFGAASRLAAANAAYITYFDLSADVRDRLPDPAPGRIVAVVGVALHTVLPFGDALCRDLGARMVVCRATALSAAQER